MKTKRKNSQHAVWKEHSISRHGRSFFFIRSPSLQIPPPAMAFIRASHGIGPVLLILSIVTSTQQYVYSCNATATCGCSNHTASMTRIVGGEPAGTSTWGWTVSILISPSGLCDGAIVSSTWIMSAAHCFVHTNASNMYFCWLKQSVNRSIQRLFFAYHAS